MSGRSIWKTSRCRWRGSDWPRRCARAAGDAPLPGESVALARAPGRVTAEAVYARLSAPHYHAAAMDGYAVAAAATFKATETRPQTLRVPEDARPVNTGDALPAGTDSVIMIEHTQEAEGGTVIRSAVAPWQHVRPMGEDMVASELVLPPNHVLRPVDLGALAGCGYHSVAVRRRPRVALLPTGSELVAPGVDPAPGQVIESNSLVLAAQVEGAGGEARVLESVADEPARIRQALRDALAEGPDLLLLLSGSSAGSRDYSAAILREEGELLVHGVALRPGHPVILGMVGGTPVIGVPGLPGERGADGRIVRAAAVASVAGAGRSGARIGRGHDDAEAGVADGG